MSGTKQRFEARRARRLKAGQDFRKIRQGIISWYQFSREGNAEGLLRAYTQWPPHGHRSRRRRGWNARVLRGGSWNNNDRDNLASSNRNNNTSDNRDNNNGFRCVVVVGRSSPKPGASSICESPGGNHLPGQCQDARLTHAPVPCEKTCAAELATAVRQGQDAAPARGPATGTTGVSSRVTLFGAAAAFSKNDDAIPRV